MFLANKGKNLEIDVFGTTYLRLPIKTRMITEKDKILDLLQEYVAPHIIPGDFIFISEKVVALCQNRIVKIASVKSSWLAKILARRVKNYWNTPKFRGFGYGTPMAMQLLINEIGYPRVILAAIASTFTRPLGIHGVFYIVAGKLAKTIDCPMSFVVWPYTQYAKLPPLEPQKLAQEIKQKFGRDVVIVDANYRGVFSLARTENVQEKFVKEVFRDNPLGQSDEMTPFCIVRKK